MKKILILLLFLISNLFFAQDIIVIGNPPLSAPDSKRSHIGEESENSDDIVPLAILEQIPIFPGCENMPREEAFACFNEMINKHITKYVVYSEEMLKQKVEGRVYVQFVINKEGKVEDINVRGKNMIFYEEAKRVIALLPQFKPGLIRGIPVKVSHVVPVNFKLQ